MVDEVLYLKDILVKYFKKRFTRAEIQGLLEKIYDKKLSKMTIKRKLHALGLKRKYYEESDMILIATSLVEELFSSGYNLGIKAVWEKILKKHSIVAKRETVYTLMKIIDSERLANRFCNRLKRRVYLSPGPNFLWHLDGYDKLKPFGFSIHACIDGYLRFILWLEVANTNKDPKVIAYYYLKVIKSLRFMPTLIRSDEGTENIDIERYHLRHEDDYAGASSFIEGIQMT